VQGTLGSDWSSRLSGLEIRSSVGPTGESVSTLEGPLRDQAALAGVINALYSLRLPILSVERGEADEESS
jgi:hypothetical protein